ERNISRYREQLDRIGFSYDWSREVRTSDPAYYRWTQWIFKQIYNAWYNKDTDKAEPIETLREKFRENGNFNVNAAIEENWWKNLPVEKYGFPFGEYFSGTFTATDWASMNEEQQLVILSYYRLTYLDDAMVNWCPALGTVLANDEIKDGLSERGGHPVVQKRMKQWMMRITAYADRLLTGMDTIDWTDAIKDQQRNWIGRSEGAMVKFQVWTPSGVEESGLEIQVFTTRPDTIFGVGFMVLAPEHDLVQQITTEDCKAEVEEYIRQASLKSERDRQANVKDISGAFTGAYVRHPFSGEDIPVWIADYVLAGYGTGAVMAVPSGDERDHAFAKHFSSLHIKPIFENVDVSEEACTDRDAKLIHSGFLNGMDAHKAIPTVIEELEKKGIGWGKINYRLRDAVFSRQRYWGEPFPVYYKNDVPYLTEEDVIELPPVDRYLPTEEGEPPLARARKEDWKVFHGEHMDYNTMPGWAGSSWYYLRYMDPHNEHEFCSREKSDYWDQVDLYMGGAEHATGHLLYSRFWCKILFDLGYIGFDEPFKKMINQGMIQGVSNFVYRVKDSKRFVSKGLKDSLDTTPIHADISLVHNGVLDVEGFKEWRPEFADADFELEDDKYLCGTEVEKMSKSKYNVINPDELCDKYGADTLRCYEMFLGPIEQHKPWDTNGITGVHNFLRKVSRLFQNMEQGDPNKDNLKTIHKTIKKVTEDVERFSFNTVVSALMICVNELNEQKCSKSSVLESLVVLLSPYAPHLAEELWEKLGKSGSVTMAKWPSYNEEYLTDDTFDYPVSFNGKMRFKMEFPVDLSPDEIKAEVLAAEASAKYLEGKEPKKVIVVPNRIVNVVV
ncbi:MAG: leucine--tRNA ligase, partial [Flavobacteriales bacterium]|nr:leucine--tRNA ligase [Flavobacteriales bacterium]